jgi:hypothetical protein
MEDIYDQAIERLTEQAINVWQAGHDISFDLACTLMEIGVDVPALERRYVK